MPERFSGQVAAIVRRLPQLSQAELIDLLTVAAGLLNAPSPEIEGVLRDGMTRKAALTAMADVAVALQLDEGTAPTAKQFNDGAPEVAPGWNTSRVVRIFGRWEIATRAYLGNPEALTAHQRAQLRAARKGVFREREDYVAGVALWLATDPPSQTTADYDAWQREHNAELQAGEDPVVSYSMLRKVLPWSWETTKQVARGLIDANEAPHRPAAEAAALSGPHDLVSMAEVRRILGLGRTAAANRSRSRRFPPPAYTHPRPPGMRLWRRGDIRAFAAGMTGRDHPPNDLQDEYMDAHALAGHLGLAVITVTTRSSPLVPEPAVLVGGLQLWLRTDLENAA